MGKKRTVQAFSLLMLAVLLGCSLGLKEQPNLSAQEQLVQVSLVNITHTPAAGAVPGHLTINTAIKNNGTALPVGQVQFVVEAGGVRVPVNMPTGKLAATASVNANTTTLSENVTVPLTDTEVQTFITAYRQRGAQPVVQAVRFYETRPMNVLVELTAVVPPMTGNWSSGTGTYTFRLTNNDTAPYGTGTWSITTGPFVTSRADSRPALVAPGQTVTFTVTGIARNSILGTQTATGGNNNNGSSATHGMWGYMQANGRDLTLMKVEVIGDVLQ